LYATTPSSPSSTGPELLTPMIELAATLGEIGMLARALRNALFGFI
jgi:hypothetical protein